MPGTDDEDYWVPPGTKIVMSYGPEGPSPQPIDGELCTRPTREQDAEELEAVLVAERQVYQESLTKSGRSIPSHRHRNLVLAEGTARGEPRDTRFSAAARDSNGAQVIVDRVIAGNMPAATTKRLLYPKPPSADTIVELTLADLLHEDE